MVQHVIERLGEVRGPNYDFQNCESFRNLTHHIGHMMSWRPCRKSATLATLATFLLTICRSLREGAEVCSDLGFHEVHAALELNSYLMKLMKTFWTKTNPPPSKKAVSRRRLEEVKQQRSGKQISKSSLPCRTRGTCVRLRKTT